MAENTDTLGAGTFGGNGFWVARQTDYPAHQLMLGAFADIILRPWPALPCPSEYNTNNISPRAVSDALNYDASLLKVEGQEPVEFWLSPTTAAPKSYAFRRLSDPAGSTWDWWVTGSYSGGQPQRSRTSTPLRTKFYSSRRMKSALSQLHTWL